MAESDYNFGDTLATVYESINTDGPEQAPRGNPITPRLAALVTDPNGVIGLEQRSIDNADMQIQNGGEERIRMKAAVDRQQRQLKNLNKFLDGSATGITSQQSLAETRRAYDSIVNEDISERAKTALEREAIDRIQDDLTSNNPVEAKLTYNLMFGRGNAMKVWHDEATKNLILAQKIGEYEDENENSSWARSVYGFLTDLIPTNYNFSRSGIVEGAPGGIRNWLLAGTGLQTQGETMWNKYQTPEAFADALKTGGELDASLRSNSTTLGVYNPKTSADLLKSLSYQSDSDRLWANAWGVADPAFVLPWGKIGSIPKNLARLGSRSAARNTVAAAVEDIVARGPVAAARASAIPEAEIVSHLEPTALNASASTEGFVPLATDVASRLEAAQRTLDEVGQIVQVSRATNPQEVAHALETRVREIEKQVGRSVKDVEYVVEDVATKVERPYQIGEDLPEQGNSIFKARVTFGKKSGGGFATMKSALSEARNRLGITGKVVGSNVEREIVQTAAEAGFTQRAFHGTGRGFSEFDRSFAGSATGAENTRGGVTFFTDDPDVASGYARLSASADNNREFKAAQEAFQKDPSDANYDRFEAAMERVADDAGANVRPVDLDTRNFADVDMKGARYNGPITQAIIDKAKADGKDGVIFRNYDDDLSGTRSRQIIDAAANLNSIGGEAAIGGKYSTTFAVFNDSAMRSAFEGPITKRDVSGQFFVKADFNVPLDGFTTTALNTPDNGFFRFGRSTARRLDRDTQQKAVAAGTSGVQLQAKMGKMLKDSLKGISAADHGRLDEIVRAGQNKDRWFEADEFNLLWERLTGDAVAPARVQQAYDTYRTVNDMEFILRRNEVYKADANAGRENVKFKLGQTGINIDATGRVSNDVRPTERVFDASRNHQYNSRNPLTEERWEALKGEGYVVVTLKEPVAFPDGTRLRQVMMRKGELERGTLQLEKGLSYKAGGHRAYTGKYFIKQAAGGVQPDTGGKYLMNPNVFRTGNNVNKLKNWSSRFNKALDDFNAGILDPQHYDDNVFANMEGLSFPSGEDFLRGLDEGRISKDHYVEVVGDREMPSAYNSIRDDVDRFIDEDETSIGGYYRSTGRMYTSGRGNALLDESGEFAETVDPWETMDRAINNISRMSSFSNYKNNAMERFKATYGEHLALRQLETASPADLIKAKPRDYVDPRLRRKIEAEQSGFAAIMNHETDFERRLRSRTREVAEWVLGDATGGPREMAHDFVYWLSKNNPVNFLRGLAFDAKLGMFNIGQFFLQSSTMVAATALSPKHGMRGMFGSAPLFAFVQSKGSENVLDVLAKRGVWKAASFESENEFKDFARFAYKSGFLDVNQTHLTINDYRPSRYFGATSKVDAVREAGRAFFYSAEIFNRAVAGRIAWEELKEQGVRLGSAEFRERFIGLADDYSFNMTSESSASFQRGALSIPTQFWGYNVRMMDAMFGSRFTKEQRLRLLVSQFALYGAGGVPVADAIAEYVRTQTGESAEAGSVTGLIDRGMLDNAIHAVTGADVRVGERIGTGTFLTETLKSSGAADVINAATRPWIGEIFHVSEFNRISPLEFAGGATFSITGAISKTLTDVVKYSAAEGGVQGPITRDNLIKVADNVATFSNFHKAYLADRYGIYRSQSGTISGSDLPREDAMWFALGLGRPQEADTAEFQKAFIDRKEDIVKEAATRVRNWRQEAFTRPDIREENAQKVNTFLQLYPADVRMEIIKRTNKITDKSFYDFVQRKYDEEVGTDGNNG